MLGILFHGTKIEANSRNSVLKHSAEQKTLGIQLRTVPQRRKMLEFYSVKKNRSKLSKFRSEACLGQKHAVYSVCWSRIFCKTNFSHSIFFRSKPQNRLFRKPQNNRSSSDSIQRSFSERNFIANPRAVMVAVTPLTQCLEYCCWNKPKERDLPSGQKMTGGGSGVLFQLFSVLWTSLRTDRQRVELSIPDPAALLQ